MPKATGVQPSDDSNRIQTEGLDYHQNLNYVIKAGPETKEEVIWEGLEERRKDTEGLKVKKFKRRARIFFSTQGSLDVHFFLAYEAETHPGSETVLDVLDSGKTFIPLEDILTNDILLVGKTEIMYIELFRDTPQEPQKALEIPVKVELLNGEIMEGSFFSDLPPDRLRLSDYLSYTPQFIFLWGDKTDHILNKARILSVKHR